MNWRKTKLCVETNNWANNHVTFKKMHEVMKNPLYPLLKRKKKNKEKKTKIYP